MKYFCCIVFALLLSGSTCYLYNRNSDGAEQKVAGGTIDSTEAGTLTENAPEFIGGKLVADGIIVPDLDSLPCRIQSDSAEAPTLRLKNGVPEMEPPQKGK